MIASYCRVSTDEKSTGQTTEAQKYSIEGFAKNKGLVVDKYYEDSGWSGSLIARPQLDALREDIRKGLVQKVLIYHPDRLSRKQSFQFLLLEEFEKAGVEVTFTALPEFFEGSKESLIVNKSIYSMIAELERLRISERFRLGKLRKVSEGTIITSRPPYGYKYLVGQHALEIDASEIKVVKFILNWALDGKSDWEIIKFLLDKGIKTRKGNDVWAKSTIHKVLNTNLDVYTGVWSYNKYRQSIPVNPVSVRKYKHSEKSSRVLNDKEDWISIKLPGRLKIITEEQADQIRKLKRLNRAIKKGNIKNNYLLQGRIYCSSCSGLNYCDNFHGTPYYRCADKRRSFPYPPKCPGGSVAGKNLEVAVWDKLISLITNPELIKKEAEEYIKRNTQDTIASPEVADILKRKVSLQKEREKLSEGYTKGFISNGDMARETKRIKEEELVVTQEENELLLRNGKAKDLDINSLTGDIERLAGDIKQIQKETTFEDRRNILSWLSVRVLYFRHKYSIRGGIPIYGTKLHVINFKHGESFADTSIPFLLTGALKSNQYQFA